MATSTFFFPASELLVASALRAGILPRDCTFTESDKVAKTEQGFVADYISTVSNYSHAYKHLNPPGFMWHRRFEVFRPFTAKLTVEFPGGGLLHIMNVASPVSARKTCLFVPICRNFDKDAPIEATLDFNYQDFAEDIAIVEQQFPEDLPLDLHAEARPGGSKFHHVPEGTVRNRPRKKLHRLIDWWIISTRGAFAASYSRMHHVLVAAPEFEVLFELRKWMLNEMVRQRTKCKRNSKLS